MPLFSRFSIKRKLILMFMTVSGVALLLISSALAIYDTLTFRQAMVQQSVMLANVIGYNSAAALTFREVSDAEATLESLATEPQVEYACIYTKEGTILASYKRVPSSPLEAPPVEPANARFEENHLILFQTIHFRGERLGTVYIKSRLNELNARLERYTYLIVGVLALAGLVAFGLSSRLQRVVSDPIRNLLTTANQVARAQDYTIRAKKQSDDELGLLVDGFNDMLTQIQRQDAALQQAQNDLEKKVEERTEALQQEINERIRTEKALETVHRQLLEISREMGMAEVATGVLHNVGNVLNSVNVSSNLITEGLRNTRTSAENLARAAELMNAQGQNLGAFMGTDPRGKLLSNYFTVLAEQLKEESEESHREVELLAQNIAHIRDIVSTQQNYATTSGLIERIQVKDVVEYAIQLSQGSLERHRIEVIRDYQETPAIDVDKHKIIQIIVNLVRNAKDAMSGEALQVRRLTVRITQPNRKQIVILVSDTGIGIPPEDLTRIFSHGFTTKQDGHGFGLHSAALAAKQLNAVLSVASDGPGKGAAFTLVLPV